MIREFSWAIIFGNWKPWFDSWFNYTKKEADFEIDFGVTVLKTSFYFWYRKTW